ncbi:MAG: hypothetical protein RIS47_436 [Bacteroidota bacterium]|jgi:internalin A
MKYLDTLSKYNTIIDSIQKLAKFPTLNALYLCQAWVHDISYLGHCNDFDVIQFNSLSISDISALENKTRLKALGIVHCKLSDLSPIQHLVQLEILDLSHNEISEISPLFNLKNLSQLKLSGNPLKPTQLRQLRKNLPNCTLIFEAKPARKK